jgi:hypothetical protein
LGTVLVVTFYAAAATSPSAYSLEQSWSNMSGKIRSNTYSPRLGRPNFQDIVSGSFVVRKTSSEMDG